MRDLDQLAKALRGVLPGGDTITAIRPMTTGFSNETYSIDGPDLILRLPPAAGAMLEGHDVVGQARIYEELSLTVNLKVTVRSLVVVQGTFYGRRAHEWHIFHGRVSGRICRSSRFSSRIERHRLGLDRRIQS